MAIWLCLRWWYGAGWQWAVKRALWQRLLWCNEMFSMAALLRTLLAPFKQTQSRGGGSLDMRMHAFMDNIISRFVGLFARTFIILVGIVCSVIVLVTGVVFVAIWPLIPLTLPAALLMIGMGVGR